MIYTEHPEVGAIIHVHAWIEGIRSTEVNYPCGTRELAVAVADLVREAPDPGTRHNRPQEPRHDDHGLQPGRHLPPNRGQGHEPGSDVVTPASQPGGPDTPVGEGPEAARWRDIAILWVGSLAFALSFQLLTTVLPLRALDLSSQRSRDRAHHRHLRGHVAAGAPGHRLAPRPWTASAARPAWRAHLRGGVVLVQLGTDGPGAPGAARGSRARDGDAGHRQPDARRRPGATRQPWLRARTPWDDAGRGDGRRAGRRGRPPGHGRLRSGVLREQRSGAAGALDPGAGARAVHGRHTRRAERPGEPSTRRSSGPESRSSRCSSGSAPRSRSCPCWLWSETLRTPGYSSRVMRSPWWRGSSLAEGYLTGQVG